MELVWEDARRHEGEASRQHAKLPGGIGWVNVAEREAFGPKGRPALSIHYMINALPDGLPSFSGMPGLEKKYASLEDLKADAPRIVADAMASRIKDYEGRIAGIRRAMSVCGM